MKTTLTLFLATFFITFLLNFQTINAVHYYYGLTVVTSIGISWANYYLFKLVPNKLTWVQFLAYLMGGAIGSVFGLLIHQFFLQGAQHVI
jgi:hypothetical protein